jgi:hypothetical protein
MNHKTGKIITKNGKTGIIINKAPIYQCWEIKWEDGTYSIERDEGLKAAPSDANLVVRQPPSLCYESPSRQALHWKVKGDKFSKFVKNKRRK